MPASTPKHRLPAPSTRPLERRLPQRTHKRPRADLLLTTEPPVRDIDPDRAALIVQNINSFAIFSTDLTGTVLTWNPGATRFLGFEAHEIIGKKADFVFTPEDRQAGVPENEMATSLQRGEATDIRWHLRADGSRIWANGMMSLLRDPNGKPIGFAKVLRDETGRKLAEEALSVAKETAEAASRAKDDFLAAVSHELRNPLSAILLWSKILVNLNDPAKLVEGLTAIRKAAEAQRDLVDDLLDTGRIVRGQMRLGLGRVALRSVVQDAVDAIRPTADVKGVRLSLKHAPADIIIRADTGRLQQVFWNLLTNAVKFTPAGGSVRVSVRGLGHDVEIRVVDTGLGMDAGFVTGIFHPFSNAGRPAASFDASTPRQGGLGLGLAITRRLVELHGGTLSVRSPGPGKGSTFVVRLPVPGDELPNVSPTRKRTPKRSTPRRT